MVVIIQTSGLNSFRSLTFLSLKELEIASTSWFASTIPIWRWLEVINHSVLDAGMWWLSHRVVSDSCDPMDYSLPGSSVHEISQARILEWVGISYSRGSSWFKDQTCISCTGNTILYHWATREALGWVFRVKSIKHTRNFLKIQEVFWCPISAQWLISVPFCSPHETLH